MEAGLGIDSIKQVEILSELQERLPGIPEIAPDELASLRTLRDVAEKLAALPALEVVRFEKTGYPVEMLDLDMEMEAGLGIDSIKQVEILSFRNVFRGFRKLHLTSSLLFVRCGMSPRNWL